MLQDVDKYTQLYTKTVPKSERKKIGQFFTDIEIAKFMVSLYNKPTKKHVSVLDAGAGSGILSCAFVEWAEKYQLLESIDITCYENDNNIIPTLVGNLEHCKQISSKKIHYQVFQDNYITSQASDFNAASVKHAEKYDYVIGNPPYMKISKMSAEAKAMSSLCHGTPNLYFLFAAMGLFNLADDGEMVYIMPRSWTSGAYFQYFREYLLSNSTFAHLHLFDSRSKVFSNDSILQETMIMKIIKTHNHMDEVKITTSESGDIFRDISSLTLPYNTIFSANNNYILLPTNQNDAEIIRRIHSFGYTLPSIGVKAKTGIVVDFRAKPYLTECREDGVIPLFCCANIENGEVKHPTIGGHRFLRLLHEPMMQHNTNLLLLKRVTSKEESRRLQCGIYLANDYPQYTKISTDNKLNFIVSLHEEMPKPLVYGLYVLFGSTMYDRYYKILNGSTQVNSTELNSIPIPGLDVIMRMGEQMMFSQDLSENGCNSIIGRVL